MKLKQTIFIGIVFLLLSSCSTKSLPYANASKTSLQLQAILDSIYSQHPRSVGIMAHVEAPDQRISWSGAAGFADKEKKTKLLPDQTALIASNTKTYVATTILRLVEQGQLNLTDPIGKHLSSKTKAVLSKDQYDLEEINITHLLSHTSGIFDYVNAAPFMAQLQKNAAYQWTRDEQIALAISHGQPLGKAGDLFAYADTNYLLLSEIIEQITGKKFYTAIRELIDYDKHDLNASWFISLEEQPKKAKALVKQYYSQINLNSRQLSPSFDLYGGGGIAASTKDLARFSQLLFEAKIFKKAETLNLIYTKVATKDQKDAKYYLGLSESEVKGLTAYGHGGFWGTIVQYIPQLNCSIAVFILERDQRYLRIEVLDKIVAQLIQN